MAKKNNVYFVDLIGSYAGMHYYADTFKDVIKSANTTVDILSIDKRNNGKRFFPLIFKGNPLRKFTLMIWCYIKLFCFILSHKGKFVYFTYGEIYDALMISLCAFFGKRIIVDIHEVYALKYQPTSLVSKVLLWEYKYIVRNVIYHSETTKNRILDCKFDYEIYVPHLNYNFPKTVNDSLLGQDVKNVFNDNSRKKFLFFGSLSKAKGADIVADIFSNIGFNGAELVVAGKNVDDIDFSAVSHLPNCEIITRHINDDEMTYLFMNCDYVLLPYRRSSQSGIVAMAEYFRKPMLLSDIPYFDKIYNEANSIGFIARNKDFGSLVADITSGLSKDFYIDEDCNVLFHKREIEKFSSEFQSFVNS